MSTANPSPNPLATLFADLDTRLDRFEREENGGTVGCTVTHYPPSRGKREPTFYTWNGEEFGPDRVPPPPITTQGNENDPLPTGSAHALLLLWTEDPLALSIFWWNGAAWFDPLNARPLPTPWKAWWVLDPHAA